MIEQASKYSKLPSAQERGAAASLNVQRSTVNVERSEIPIPVLKKPIWKDVDAAAGQIHTKNQGDLRSRGCQILIPRYRATMSQGDWRWKELREGGCLHAYLNRMRGKTKQRWQAVGRARANFKQNPKSDLQLMASVPAYDYFRWKRMDPHFFSDPKNLRALKRDNPHVTSVFV